MAWRAIGRALAPLAGRPARGLATAATPTLPRLPLPRLEDTIHRYLDSVAPLQDADARKQTQVRHRLTICFVQVSMV